MSYQRLEPVSKQLTIVIGLTVVGFMAFGLALSFYRNALFDQTLKNIHLQNTALQNTIDLGYQDLEYYRSTQYKDKYAKENLGLAHHGETVLILTEHANRVDPALAEEEVVSEEQREAMYSELLRQMPVIEHWKLFIFYPDKIEELKKAL